MTHVKNGIAAFTLVLTALLSGYLATATFMHSKALEDVSISSDNDGSYDYKGVNFRDTKELQRFIKQEKLEDFFPWISSMPIELVPMILSVSTAAFGGVAAVLSTIVRLKKAPWATPYVGQPLFGAAVGLMLFLLSFLIPSVLTTGDSPPRAESIAAISFFGGLFSNQTFQWIENQVGSFLAKNKKTGAES